MSAGRCLSDLPDDLLRHILFFAPTKEAAATAVLSRRWRSLWRTCGAVNMDSRSYGRRLDASARDAFFRDAEAALAAATAPVRRLTIYVELEDEDKREMATYWSRTKRAAQVLHDMIGAVLSNPTARQVEELRVGALLFGRASANVFTGLGLGALSYGAHHPSEALRVLHLTNCSSFTPPPPGTSSFPQLKEMRLRWCGVPCAELQGMIDAAPLLATLRLEFVDLSSADEITLHDPPRARCYMLRCPAATALVLENCACPWVPDGIELDTPRLRYLSEYH
nr:unnamed protein product [Digitaria exilis]